MVRRFTLALSVVWLLAAASSAEASFISFTDTFDPATVGLNGATACTGTNATDTVSATTGCSSLSWTHDLLLLGFDPALPLPRDTLTLASLTIALSDDGDSAVERFDITMDSLSVTGQGQPVGTHVFTTPAFDLLTHLSDGMLNVVLRREGGATTGNAHDFNFLSAVLYAEGDRQEELPEPVPVPEPASLLLLGMGAVGLAARFRRQR